LNERYAPITLDTRRIYKYVCVFRCIYSEKDSEPYVTTSNATFVCRELVEQSYVLLVN